MQLPVVVVQPLDDLAVGIGLLPELNWFTLSTTQFHPISIATAGTHLSLNSKKHWQ
jgi:hypothetical protein